MARYARKLTRYELVQGGITMITEDGRVWKNGMEIKEFPLNNSGYRVFNIWDRDENGCCIKIIDPKKNGHYWWKPRTISLNRAMLAWFYGSIEDGYVADHIDRNKNNYNIANLRAISAKENVTRDRDCNIREIKCRLDRPRGYYEDRLEEYLKEYELAKEAGNAKECHRLRANISQTRARLRYWDSHH